MKTPVFENEPNDKNRKTINPMLKLALEMGPLMVFFFANSRAQWLVEKFPVLAQLGEPIFVATALFMVAITISLIVSFILTRTIPIMPLVSGIVVMVFGGLTLYFHNDLFVKLKPTIINGLFASVLLGGLLFGKSLLGYVFDSAFKLDDEGWRKLTLNWGLFFVFLAILNEVIWRNVSTDMWLIFKVWLTMPITIIFTMTQMPLVIRHSTDNQFKSEKPSIIVDKQQD